MSYAIVKFINETDEQDEIVSEVPSSWLTRGNQYCKWPPEKHAALYISKNFPPLDEWKDYPVEVECFCESLAEAKEKVKGVNTSDVGRGFRKQKPIDYFSPAEEEERQKGKKKEAVLKKISPIPHHDLEEDCHKRFINLLNEDDGENISTSGEKDSGDRNEETKSESDTNILLPEITEGSSSTILSGGSSTGEVIVTSASVVTDTEILRLENKIDRVLNCLSQFIIDLRDIKQRLDIPEKDQEQDVTIELPLKSLAMLEELELNLKENPIKKRALIKIIKNIGGNDSRDFAVRVCRNIFTNSLAELCSWTGRKNNFCIGNLALIRIVYGVVHNKTGCTQKDFEHTVSEWLRHAKQRREREEKKLIQLQFENTADL